MNAAVSPNHVLLSTVSSSLLTTRTSVYSLPTHHAKDLPYQPSGTFVISFYHLPHVSHVEELTGDTSLSSALVAAIHARKTTSDVTHILSLASTNVGQVADTLYATLSTFSEGELDKRMSALWTWEVLGIAVEIYGCAVRIHLRLRYVSTLAQS